jgi:excisionase family DNA binding protein
MNDKLLYRIPEVAEHLSISRSKVYELLKSGELRSVHIDRSRLVRARDLQAYVDSLAAASWLSAPLRNLRSDTIFSEPKSIDHGNPLTSRHRQRVHGGLQASDFLENNDFALGCISVDIPKWWSKWWPDP